MTELTFYTNPKSRGRIVRWMLEETEKPYRTEIVPFGAPMKSSEYRAVNPMGKVPSIRHGETVVTDGHLQLNDGARVSPRTRQETSARKAGT